MKKVSLLLLAFAVLLSPLSVQADDLKPTPADVEGGKSAAGQFVIPKVLAHHCGVKLKKTSSAKKKLKKCLTQLLKEKNSSNEKKRLKAQDILREALAENRLATFKEAVKEKVYAADFEEKELKDFQDKVKGKDTKGGIPDVSGGMSQATANLGGEGDSSSEAVREDWGFIAQGDQIMGTSINEHMNMIIATEIMNKALNHLNSLTIESEKEGEGE